ncbi:UNVERIFIED_ORG: two-component system capsular synthesis sensor histidine kinase RcsC [Burkholderia sp. 1263]
MSEQGSATESPPLRTLKTLDNSLKRERRVFAMVVSLLIFAAICAAAVTLASRLSNVLSLEEQAVRSVAEELDNTLIRRHAMLTTARLVIEQHEQGLLAAPVERAVQPICTPLVAARAAQTLLGAICDETVRLLATVETAPPLQFIMVDGSAAYGHRLAAGAPRDPAQGTGGDLRRLTHSILNIMQQRGGAPLSAAQERSVIWFPLPAALGPGPQLMLGATIIWKDHRPYAIVLTSIDPSEFSRPSATSPLRVPASLIGSDGSLLTGNLPPGKARAFDAYLAAKSAGRFHWLPNFGWGLRLPPLAFGVGHLLLALPWSEQVNLMRSDIALVLFTTCALVALLVAMTCYWNYRFLTRSYAEASRALERELLNHLLVQVTPVGLSIVRRRDLEIIVANPIARNVLRLSDDATRFPDDLCAEFQRRGHEPEPADGGTPVSQFHFSVDRGGPNGVHLEITYAPAVLNREEVLFCALADMTERYEAEQMLREAKLASDAVAKAKVSFFAAMSHEIRTPLASLVGNIELVALGQLVPEQEARVRSMQMSATGLLQIVNDVLDFSRMEVDELRLTEEWASMRDFLGRVVVAHAPLATRQALKFYVVVDRNVPSLLLFDPVRVAQVLNNLLGNALKFTKSGKIVLAGRWVNEALEISVTDSGIGIPDELKDRLFQPFVQGDGQSLTHMRGTGLGLSICARLCKLMGGQITLDSTGGIGTRVVVTLPLKRPESDAAGASERTLPERNPAILCRATEHQEWLTSLFDPETSSPALLADCHEAPAARCFDYLLVTDEFTPQEVLLKWGSSFNVVWVTQNGPLVPVYREDGSIEVSIYRLPGIRAATQMLNALPKGTGRSAEYPGAPAPGRNFGKLNVLIVEDNLLNQGLLRDQLRTLGANVLETEHGQDALALLEKERVDMVLTDINMPVMNGYELLKAIRARYPSLPVYAVSANARPEDIALGRKLGFTCYFSKPVPLAALATMLDLAASPDLALRDESIPEPGIPRFPVVPPSYCDAFVDQSNRDLIEFENILKTHDIARLKHWTHGVSGGLSVLGPSMLFETCQELGAAIATSEDWNDDIESLAVAIASELVDMRGSAQEKTAEHDKSA